MDVFVSFGSISLGKSMHGCVVFRHTPRHLWTRRENKIRFAMNPWRSPRKKKLKWTDLPCLPHRLSEAQRKMHWSMERIPWCYPTLWIWMISPWKWTCQSKSARASVMVRSSNNPSPQEDVPCFRIYHNRTAASITCTASRVFLLLPRKSRLQSLHQASVDLGKPRHFFDQPYSGMNGLQDGLVIRMLSIIWSFNFAETRTESTAKRRIVINL